jgi:hypothetical protein
VKLPRLGYYVATCCFFAAGSNIEGWQIGCLIGLLFVAEVISFEDGFNAGWDSCDNVYRTLIRQELDKVSTTENIKQ